MAAEVGGEAIGFNSRIEGSSKVPAAGSAAVNFEARLDNSNNGRIVVIVAIPVFMCLGSSRDRSEASKKSGSSQTSD
jgi:hypothetical protein